MTTKQGLALKEDMHAIGNDSLGARIEGQRSPVLVCYAVLYFSSIGVPNANGCNLSIVFDLLLLDCSKRLYPLDVLHVLVGMADNHDQIYV